MVTSNKLANKKVVKMAERNNSTMVPHRTLLGEVNEHITCPLCRGYYIDATTIVECLHSFCRSCIIKHLQVKSYCPECEMMINSARPNIKPDKALQDIVYKLVPGLFQREMERRQQFYSSRPGPAASATPEQRGEDTERIIFSPEDVISFSLEYADATDTDSVSSKSSDSNDPQPTTTRRFLQCPAVVNISHLKKFISMKFDIDSTQYSIDILYKRVPLPDYYTLMDIAYIYNWKRNEPMRFFYQITDFIAIRTRYGLFDINRKSSHCHDHKVSPPKEELRAASPVQEINVQGSEASSGTNSPELEESNLKKQSESLKKDEKEPIQLNDAKTIEGPSTNTKSLSLSKKCDDEVEKSQFLNSFELTAKSNNSTCGVKSPLKSQSDLVKNSNDQNCKETETNKCSNIKPTLSSTTAKEVKPVQPIPKQPIVENSPLKRSIPEIHHLASPKRKLSESHQVASSQAPPVKDTKPPQIVSKPAIPDCAPLKRPIPGSQHLPSSKRKPNDNLTTSPSSKTVSPLKLQVPKTDSLPLTAKTVDTIRPTIKKMPDLKPSVPSSLLAQNKGQIVGKLRMDLLANNSDPTIDRSKILSQVKSSLSSQTSNQTTSQMSGDPLKSLFDSCKINIPSSLSITLTDQKDQRNPNDPTPTESKKTVANKNLSLAGTNNTGAHKVPSPPVHNYIEILKLPDSDPKKQLLKTELNPQSKLPLAKCENTAAQSKIANKSSETSAKGPMPSLKPIADTKLAKQGSNSLGPVTFQQTFEQQLLSIQSDKTKLPKNKLQVPKLMPATPKALSAANKLQSNTKPISANIVDNKTPIRSDNALDLSTQHNLHSQLGAQQTKAFETMQSIANLAKKQTLPTKSLPMGLTQNSMSSGISTRPQATAAMPVKSSPTATSPASTYQMGSHSSSTAQPSPRSQTRSPSSSPKLVIAEEKQINTSSEQNLNQSNQITSTQLSSLGPLKSESPKSSPGPSKQVMKPVTVKSLIPAKIPGIRQPMMMSHSDMHMQMQHAMLRQHMEIQNAWFKAQRLMSHQANNKDNSKQQ